MHAQIEDEASAWFRSMYKLFEVQIKFCSSSRAPLA